MNIREGARRIRVIAMYLLALGIAAVAIDLVIMHISRSPAGSGVWLFCMVPGFALALLAWVVDGFSMPEKDDSQKPVGEAKVRPV
jgi:hypothetical protein